MSIVVQTGTRTRQNVLNTHPPSGALDRGMQQDKGMTKRVATTLTMTASSKRIAGSNGDFTNFAVNDVIVVEGTNLNNGTYTVTGLDAANQAYLTVDQGVHDESSVAGIVRTL